MDEDKIIMVIEYVYIDDLNHYYDVFVDLNGVRRISRIDVSSSLGDIVYNFVKLALRAIFLVPDDKTV